MKKNARQIAGITAAALIVIAGGATALANQISADYITVKEAKAIAMTHAGVTEGGYYGYEFDFEKENGVAVYEIDFKTAEDEYEYEINAVTGEIIKNKKEINDDTRKPKKFQNVTVTDGAVQTPTATVPAVTEYILVDDVKKIALNHANVAEGGYYGYEFSFDSEHGVAVYEIEFKTAENEYEYDINAVTGEIVKNKKEINDDAHKPSPMPASATTTADYITPEEAKTIALSDAGVQENNVYDFELDFDIENGVAVYEVDFESLNYEHEYEIHAVTGEIIKSDKELRD